MSTSKRKATTVPSGYRFKPLFGATPKDHVNHVENVNGMSPSSAFNESSTNNAQSSKSLEIDNYKDRDGTSNNTNKKLKKRRKSWDEYRDGRTFQEEWVAEFWWAKQRGNRVACKVCEEVEGKEKVMDMKRDTLQKHEGKRYIHHTVGDEVVKEVVWTKNCQHLKNEQVFLARQVAPKEATVVEFLETTLENFKTIKLRQFATIFHLLKKGRPMTDYENKQELYTFLSMPFVPRKHWTDSSGWKMAEHMDAIFQDKIRRKLEKCTFFAVSLDEVTANDNTQWIAIHVYCVKNFQRQPFYLCVTKVEGSVDSKSLVEMLILNLKTFGGVKEEVIGRKLVCIGVDGAAVLQGERSGAILRLSMGHAPFMIGIHCMAHRTNLAGKVLTKLRLFERVENLSHDVYNYFSRSPKRFHEFKTQLIIDFNEEDVLKLLRDVSTRWISLYHPILRIFKQYRSLLYKFYTDMDDNFDALKNYEQLINIEMILTIPCMLPMFEKLNMLVKVAQERDVYIHDFLELVESVTQALERMYDMENGFNGPNFISWNDLVYGENEVSWLQFNEQNELCVIVGRNELKVKGGYNSLTNSHVKRDFVSNDLLLDTIDYVKNQCHVAATLLVEEIKSRFPPRDLLDAFSIVYPQFWRHENHEKMFHNHLKVLKSFYCQSKQCGDTTYAPLLDEELLNSQSILFAMAMEVHVEKTSPKEDTITSLWKKLVQGPKVKCRISEYVKLAQLALVMIIGSVEDERTFSRLEYVKNKTRNRLDEHLDLCVRFYEQNLYSLHSFPFEKAICTWKEDGVRGRYATSSFLEECNSEIMKEQ